MMAVVIINFPTSGNNQDSILGKKKTLFQMLIFKADCYTRKHDSWINKIWVVLVSTVLSAVVLKVLSAIAVTMLSEVIFNLGACLYLNTFPAVQLLIFILYYAFCIELLQECMITYRFIFEHKQFIPTKWMILNRYLPLFDCIPD